jgi:hypothetical protein
MPIKKTAGQIQEKAHSNTGDTPARQQVYTDEFALAMFCKYATFYSLRYKLIAAKKTDWRGAFFWLVQLNFYGHILIDRGIITGREFRQQKFATVERIAA